MNKIIKKYGNKIQIHHHKICHNTQKQQEENCSFKPKTHALPKQIYGTQAFEKVEVSKEEQWERLLLTKREQLENRLIEKKQKEEMLFRQICKEKPTIGAISKSLVENQQLGPVEERLFKDGIEARKRREQLQRTKFEREQFSFNPDIEQSKAYLKGDKANLKPLYERIDQVLKKKSEELQQKKQEYENQEQLFKPKISENSNKIAEQNISSKSVVERLMQDALEKVQRRLAEQQKHQQPIADQCTFAPIINPSIEFNRLTQDEFVQKQYLMADFLKEKKEKMIEDFLKNQNYTFKPQVNKQSTLLVEADRINENETDKFIRLSQKDNEKKILLQEQLNEAYYNQFTYQPKINQISATIGRKRSLQSLAYNKEGQEKLKQQRAEAEMQRQNECSFQPQIQKKDQYQYVNSKYSHDKIKENLELEEQAKKRKIDELSKVMVINNRQQEYNEFKECTFQPQTNKEFHISNKPLDKKVKGISKFIQNKENYRKQQEDKKAREKELFEYQNRYDMNKHLTETKPQPFKLSQNNTNLQKQLYEEAIRREREVCTFQPKINKKSINSQEYQLILQ